MRYAITIHKSQGQTLDKAVIDIGKSERATGCTYVAISRLRSLQDLIVEPMSFDRLLSIRNSKRLAERIKDEQHLQELAVVTASYSFLYSCNLFVYMYFQCHIKINASFPFTCNSAFLHHARLRRGRIFAPSAKAVDVRGR